jgi:hypothetical protein
MIAKVNPISRNPDLQFDDVELKIIKQKESERVELLGIIRAKAHLKGWAPSEVGYKVFQVDSQIVIGQTCSQLHLTDYRANERGWEGLWCMNCWSDSSTRPGMGGVFLPFYMLYRHYDDHVIGYLPRCATCNKKFVVWESDLVLKEDESFLFSAIKNQEFQEQVDELLKRREASGAPSHPSPSGSPYQSAMP